MPFPCALRQMLSQLSDNISNNTRTNSTAAFTDCETQTLIHSDWLDQSNGHFYVVAWHYHLNAFWQLNVTGHVSSTEVELRTVAFEERGMTA
ncbi:hypothetical protein SAMN05518863_11924, partial [Candidatus Pantoea symbiotica]